jgi:RNA polymerase sigma factor (sigma-70 family)
VASWPTTDRVDDQRLALSLRGGDADAVTQLYDSYAPGLYEYCHTLLRDQLTAAYAVHDSLVAAVEHIARLREPERLRGWLYALARAECGRLREDPDRPVDHHEAPEVEDSHLDKAARAQREDTRQLVHSALAGLTGRQREALDLTVRHELTTEELASVFGVSTRQAAELARQARSHLGKTVAAALTARTLKDDCPSLAALTDEWPLSPEACSRLVGHIESCPICGEHRPREVSINRLLQVLPIAAAPEDLRIQVLTTATAPEHHEDRIALAAHAEPLNESGWPFDPETEEAERKNRTPVRFWPVVAAAAAVVVIIGAVMWLVPSGAAQKKEQPGNVAGALPSQPAGPPSDMPPLESNLPEAPSPTPTNTTTPTPTPSPSVTPSAASTSTTRPAHRPTSRPPVAPPPPANGSLSVSGCRMGSGRRSCTITITAVGGTVNWQVTGTSGTGLRASGSGTLAAGQSAGVTVSRDGGICIGQGSGSVSFSPNGTASVSYTC